MQIAAQVRRAPARPLLRAAALAAACLTLAACSADLDSAGQRMSTMIADRDGPRLDPAPMPTYRSGQRFAYSDGRVIQVVSTDQNEVVWKNAQGQRFTADRNFVVPQLTNASGTYERAVLNDANALWPLEVGKADRLRVVRHNNLADGTRETRAARNYNCRVSGTETLSVAAGTFDTYRVQCNRFSRSGKRVVETSVWHYAPSLGHVVRKQTIDRKSGQRDVVDLVSSSG